MLADYQCSCEGTGFKGEFYFYLLLFILFFFLIYLIFCFCFYFFIFILFLSYFFYTGQFCETDIDECIEDQPCQSGTCNNLKGGYECDCFEDYCGTNCQRRDICIVSTHQVMGPKNYWKIRHHALTGLRSKAWAFWIPRSEWSYDFLTKRRFWWRYLKRSYSRTGGEWVIYYF